ncbi:MAG: hypothetical protein AAF649_12600 [Verrucomicrobiota bacterium]
MKYDAFIKTLQVKHSAVACTVVLMVSCAPEHSSHIYPEDTVGLELAREWSDNHWQVKLPAGWIIEPVFGMRDASFRVIGPVGTEAEVSISRLPIQGGSLADNVNRWRVQAGLQPWEDDAVQSLMTPITITDRPAYRMEFVSPEADGQTIYGIIMEKDTKRTFIKFSGPPAMMKSQLDAWNFFVKNLEIRHAH